jgi:hypothetical protein
LAPPELVRLPLKSFPDEEIRLAGEGVSEYIKNSLVQALLFRRNQTLISKDRLWYFKDHLNKCGDNYLLKIIPNGNDSYLAPHPQLLLTNSSIHFLKIQKFPMLLPSMENLDPIYLLYTKN